MSPPGTGLIGRLSVRSVLVVSEESRILSDVGYGLSIDLVRLGDRAGMDTTQAICFVLGGVRKRPLQKATEVIIKSFLRMTWVSLLGPDSKSTKGAGFRGAAHGLVMA